MSRALLGPGQVGKLAYLQGHVALQVAVAAGCALEQKMASKICILDWDVRSYVSPDRGMES